MNLKTFCIILATLCPTTAFASDFLEPSFMYNEGGVYNEISSSANSFYGYSQGDYVAFRQTALNFSQGQDVSQDVDHISQSFFTVVKGNGFIIPDCSDETLITFNGDIVSSIDFEQIGTYIITSTNYTVTIRVINDKTDYFFHL